MPVDLMRAESSMTAEKILFTWSGGKDSAMALHQLRKSGRYEVVALLTTVTEGYDRISMHGVRRSLLEKQACLLGIPLETIFISRRSSNEEYQAEMRSALEKYKGKGVTRAAFGDIFLKELRRYREENLAEAGMKGLFPLWKKDSTDLASAFIDEGFRAVVTCVDSSVLDESFAGREFDNKFLADLPPGVDPCGENGEFHSFVYDGPIFKERVEHRKGSVVLRDNRYYYCDILDA